MQRFAIKKLPLNVSSMSSIDANHMSIREELGEFEVEAKSIEEARELAKNRVSSDEPNMICVWSEKTNKFITSTSKIREFVHPTTLYKYDGKNFNVFVGKCHRDIPSSGKFMSKADARADYLAHKTLADEKIEAALTHLKLINDLGVSIDYHMDGDTNGIHEDYMYLEVREGAYSFEVKYSS